MSQGYVGIVRQIYERWGRGDFRAGQELYDPYVLLVIGADFPEAGAYCGPAEISYGRFGGDRRIRIESVKERADAFEAVGLPEDARTS
jgi:hypothetical protein